ncbi:MAG: SRPBCC family protein [Phycisphaerales bacterium]
MRMLEVSQWLPVTPDELWPFFTDIANLERITPDWVNFKILTPPGTPVHEGVILDYRIRIRGVGVHWRTRISAFDPPHRFVDEQIKGPYSLWRHEHRFHEERGGTRCLDRVDYRSPLGVILHPMFVDRDVRRIFEFRAQALRKLFGGDEADHPVISITRPTGTPVSIA